MKKCLNCGGAIGEDPLKVEYLHATEDGIDGSQDFLVCRPCANCCTVKKIIAKARAAYQAATLN